MRSSSVSAESSFRISLESAINDYRGPETVVKNGTAVPGFLVDAFTFLEKHRYFEHEGVFRKEGAKSRLGCLETVVLGHNTLSTVADLTVIDVCCLVKKFLRSLETPLLRNLEHNLISSTNAGTVSLQDKVVIRMLLTLVGAMDSKVTTTLSYLMAKLYELLKHENKTKMGAASLGSMLAPCLFGAQVPIPVRQKGSDKSKPTQPMEAQKRTTERQSRVIEILIQNHSLIGPHGAVFARKDLSRSLLPRQPTGSSYAGAVDRCVIMDEVKGKEKRSSSVARILKGLPKFRRSSSTNRRSSVESAASGGLSFSSLTSKLIERRPSSHVVALTSTTPVRVDQSDEEVFKPGSLEESPPPLPKSLPPSTETSPATSDKAVEYTGFKTVVSVSSLKHEASPDTVSVCSHRSRRSSPRRGNVNAARTRSTRNIPLATDLVWPSPAMEPEEMSVRSIRTASSASSGSRTPAYKRPTNSLSQADRLVKRSSTKASTKSADSPSTEKILRNRMLSGDSSAQLLANKPKTERTSRRHTAPIRFLQRNQPNTLKNGLDKKKSAPIRRNNTVIYKANADEINDENCEQLADLDINMDDSKNFVTFDTLLRPKRFNRRKETLKRDNDKNPVFLDVSDTTDDAELTPKATPERASCSASNTSRDSHVSKEMPNDDHLFKQPLHIPKRFRSQQRKNEELIQSSTESEEWVQSAAAISRIEQAKELSTSNRPSVAACEASGIVSRRIAAIESDKLKPIRPPTNCVPSAASSTENLGKPVGPPAYRAYVHPATYASRTGQVNEQAKAFETKVSTLRLKNARTKSPGRALKATPRKSVGQRKVHRLRVETGSNPLRRLNNLPLKERKVLFEELLCDENTNPRERADSEERRDSVLPYKSLGVPGFGGGNKAPLRASSQPFEL